MSTIEKYVEEILANKGPVYIRLSLVKQPRVVRKKMYEDIINTFNMMGIPVATWPKKYHIRLAKEGEEAGDRYGV